MADEDSITVRRYWHVWLLLALVFLTSWIPPGMRDWEFSLMFASIVGFVYVVLIFFIPHDTEQDKILIFLFSLSIVLTFSSIFQPFENVEVTGIWLLYNLIGIGLVVTVWFFNKYFYQINSAVLMVFAVFFTLNFVSGSFSMYLDFAQWDVITHFLGVFLLSMVVYRALVRMMEGKIKNTGIAVIAFVFASFFASVFEIVEFFGSNVVALDPTLSDRDTIFDLIVNNFAAAFGALFGLYLDRPKKPSS